MVDKNLFLHDLAIVAIIKNEAPYLKEWLDYHLLAGVDHFYLYDNDSPDNQLEVAAPYMKTGLVDYFRAPGKVMQCAVYNEAVRQFKFQCRYMAFIDGDEFIFPKTGGGVIDIIDEILSGNPNAAGLAINWNLFGSNGEVTADLTRGVLERFTRRAPVNHAPDGYGNAHVKTVANPRTINYINIPHFAKYFEERHAVNENGKIVQGAFNNPVTAEKIAVNHYYTKSEEEYLAKVQRGRSDTQLPMENEFEKLGNEFNVEFDDGILKYRDERAKTFRQPDKSHVDERLLNALMVNLSPTLLPKTPQKFYTGKMETFLTCQAVAAYLQSKLVDDAIAKSFEEAALKAILRSINGMSLADARMLLRELPRLLKLPYPAVKEIRAAALQIIPQTMNIFRLNSMWRSFVELNYLQELLQE